jgi:competence protein ComEC
VTSLDFFRTKRFRQTTIISAFLIAFLIGVGTSNFVYINASLWLLALMAVAMVFLWKFKNIIAIILVIIFGLLAGFARGNSFNHQLTAYNHLYNHQISVTGVAIEDSSYLKSGQLGFAMQNVKLANGQSLKGSLQISGYGLGIIYRGDEVAVYGKLSHGYGAYQGRINYASLKVINRNISLIDQARRNFNKGLENVLPEPMAPFAIGILIGQRSTLPEDVKKDLLMVGLTHIIAVSGYNLTIILNATNKLLRKQSKRLSTLLAVSLIAIFLLITGASASIVRASIVSFLSIIATYHGRRFKPMVIIGLTALITVYANPIYLWCDASWHLSFLAFFGILVIAPLGKARRV